MLYLIIILSAMALISIVNILLNQILFNLELWYILLAVVVNTVAVIAISGLFAFIIRHLLPAKWFSADNKFFFVSKKECKFYEKLGIKKWKDKVLELGFFTGFSKSNMQDSANKEYVERFILENNYGMVVHFVGMVVSFSIIFIYPLKFWWMFGLPVALVSMFLHLLPFCILRYNSCKLHRLRQLNIRKEKQKNKTEEN
ncbi:MAG: hypothetical protein IKW33_04230 [Clostridia bacterium]|nr:hypothetical protein [Clostridia bacterium]